ncbi:hypothetical protein SUGI_0686280 [Cryptomeria japonica]|uniref:probable 2' cyclic ADP-D-ribose synthase BdTIR n=1 Tax=Cryptomeria japonica TaxID=3369 RepID=UPI002414A573|nr:probable 2' cyclic ADP-D-ribose synthase BdTIR [Cryptomeria japonica]GLJ34135.1 hypothetical protein SUGI_0686280 [Cryptomeria japonica]
MTSTSASTCGDKPQSELANSIQRLEPCPSNSAKRKPQRLCLSIVNWFPFFSSPFAFSTANSVLSMPVTNGQPTNAFEEVAPPPSTSATSSLRMKRQPYDVFINHRGIDVKQTFATVLYDSLNAMGLRVFLDSRELKLGDFLPLEIEAAMRSASLHIIIFSQNYAQSPWCLAELSYMLKTRTKIVPVFYHVQPDDVRYGKGAYADAFSRHENMGRYTRKKLQEWKAALHNASYIRGHIINSEE